MKHNVAPGLMPDPLIPFTNALDIPPFANQSIYLKLSAKAKTPPGKYIGQVILKDENGILKKVPFTVQVYEFDLPITPSFQSSFLLQGHQDNIPSAFKVKRNSPEHLKLIKQYYELIIASRYMPYLIPSQAISQSDANIFTAEALKEMKRNTISSFGIPSGWNKINSPSRLHKIAEYLREKNLLERSYVYCIDEPVGGQFEKVIRLAETVHQANAKLRFLLTLPAYNSNDFIEFPKLIGHVNIWVPLLSAFHQDPAFFIKRKKSGDTLWWYTCNMPFSPYPTYFIDDTGVSHRVLAWLRAKYGIEGELYWHVANYGKDIWQKFKNETTPANGDGILIYPGKRFGINGPVTSLRLEILREGNEDFEYFNLLRNLLKQKAMTVSDQEITEIITPLARNLTDWENVPEILEKQRNILIDRIIELLGINSKHQQSGKNNDIVTIP